MARVSKKVDSEYNPEDQLQDFMSEYKTGHFNDEPDYNYTVSSGSLNLDIQMGGGPQPGIIRLTGMSGGGKSAASQSFICNFFKANERSRAVVIPSEGKRVENLARNQGKFKCVTDTKDWVNHSCFIYRTNIYEQAISIIRTLVENNPTDTRYIFVIDSIDALIPQDDFEKSPSEAGKVAGGALLSSVFLKQMALMISSRGHLVILISQVRNTIELNKYKPGEKRLTNANGGKALEHYADWIMEFKDHLAQADKIWEGAPGKSNILGHYCEVAFQKTTNNKTGTVVRYPIKYNPDGSGDIWGAYEIVDTLLMWEQAKSSGAWTFINESLLTELRINGFEDMPDKFNGTEKFRIFFEENPKVTEYLQNKFRKLLIFK